MGYRGSGEKERRTAVINGVSAASESSRHGIRSPMEFPWLLYWISFKFVTLSGTMLIAGRYESSRFKRSSFIIPADPRPRIFYTEGESRISFL